MINSLTTDSHTKPSLSQTSKLNKTKSMASNVILHNNIGSRSQRVTDSVSFGGYSAAKLANSKEVKELVEIARKSLSKNSQKVDDKTVNKFLAKVVIAHLF